MFRVVIICRKGCSLLRWRDLFLCFVGTVIGGRFPQAFAWACPTILLAFLVAISACGSSEPTLAAEGIAHSSQGATEDQELAALPALAAAPFNPGEKLKAVATTSIVADVVRNVGGDRIELTILVPLGTDPHSFEPSPRDVAAVADAHVVFANGLGLEGFLDALVEGAGARERTIELSRGISPLESMEGADEHEANGGDPHTWTDPTNMPVWVRNVRDALQEVDPVNSDVYESNAKVYEELLAELDAWVRQQVAQIPESERKIVTDHKYFAYFADEYGFTQVGAIVPGYSTLAEPSATELAALEDAIKEMGVKAVLVGNTVNPNLAQRVADDTGTRMIPIFTGSLSDVDGPAPNYLDYVRFNTRAILEALK
jgi:manganese/iron transport system substrate-binding protein